MNGYTIGELLLLVALAFVIGGSIGIQHGWGQACTYAEKLYLQHSRGELVVPAPVKYLNGVVFGTGWMKDRICEAR